MCGIVGILSNKENKSFVSKYIKIINKTLRHRGPDSKGIWTNSDSSVALGHNRLATVPLPVTRTPVKLSCHRGLRISIQRKYQ